MYTLLVIVTHSEMPYLILGTPVILLQLWAEMMTLHLQFCYSYDRFSGAGKGLEVQLPKLLKLSVTFNS